MKSNTLIGVVILVIVVIGAIVFATSSSTTSEVTGTDGTERAMEQAEETMVDGVAGESDMTDDAMMKDEVSEKDMMDKADDMSAGTFTSYNEDKLAMAAGGDVVLFFKADWCPSCRALEANIEANAAAIPAGVTILEVNYDTATDLKRKYGVTTQHTLVQVDQNGELIKKWLGGNTLETVVAEII